MNESLPAETRGEQPPAQLRPALLSKYLLLILAVALGLRVGFALFLTPVISGDGSEYVRMGMEIRQGKPLTGSFEWPETMYGTLYPILIAGVSKTGVSPEAAAYLLSLASGIGLIVLAFLVGRYVYGDRAGLWAALLFALFPLFIGLSGSVFNESIYLTLWLGGIYWTIRALDSFQIRDFLLVGLFFGLSTLSRPEAFAYPLFVCASAVMIGFIRRINLSRTVCGAVAVAAVWFSLMLPYAFFQHAHTGQYRFEGKWDVNYTLGERIDSGMNYFQAGFGMDDQLRPVGPLLDSSLYAAYTPYPHSFRDKLTYFAHRIRKNWLETYQTVGSIDLGGPALFVLVVLGLFATPWDIRRLRHEFILGVMGLSIVAVMVTAAHLEFRYSYPLPVILLLWAAAGIDPLVQWARRAGSSWAGRPELLAATGGIGVCALVLAFAAVGFRTNRDFQIERRGFTGIRQAGLWLGSKASKPLRIAGFEGRIAYYANGTLIVFPYADSATTIRYLESKHVEYVALDSLDSNAVPTLGQWFQNGVPEPGAQLVYESTQGDQDRIRIYHLVPQPVRTVAASKSPKE